MDDETGNGHADDLREGALGDLSYSHPGGHGLGDRPGGLNAYERAVVDRAARDASVEEGRVLFGRYASAHQGGVPEGSGGGLSDDDAVDALLDTAERFDLGTDPATVREREQLAELISASREKAAKDSEVDEAVATFSATVPNGGVSTDRNNNWIVKLEVDWRDRESVLRVIETIPMKLQVTIARDDDA